MGTFLSYAQGFWDTMAYCYTCPVFREWKKWYNNDKNNIDAIKIGNNGDENMESSAGGNRVLLTGAQSSDRRQLSTLQIVSIALFQASNWDDEYDSDEEDSDNIIHPRL